MHTGGACLRLHCCVVFVSLFAGLIYHRCEDGKDTAPMIYEHAPCRSGLQHAWLYLMGTWLWQMSRYPFTRREEDSCRSVGSCGRPQHGFTDQESRRSGRLSKACRLHVKPHLASSWSASPHLKITRGAVVVVDSRWSFSLDSIQAVDSCAENTDWECIITAVIQK